MDSLLGLSGAVDYVLVVPRIGVFAHKGESCELDYAVDGKNEDDGYASDGGEKPCADNPREDGEEDCDACAQEDYVSPLNQLVLVDADTVGFDFLPKRQKLPEAQEKADEPREGDDVLCDCNMHGVTD